VERTEFEHIVEQAFRRLPDKFRSVIDNVGITVEDYPDEEIVRKMHIRSKHHLLGLYQGIPLPQRGTWYGMTPVVPDKISLYQKNIESVSGSDQEVEETIAEVLIHEIGHYFGMTDEEIRKAGF
jgi:predicted Zn-dependent protease with MMP-like domain